MANHDFSPPPDCSECLDRGFTEWQEIRRFEAVADRDPRMDTSCQDATDEEWWEHVQERSESEDFFLV